jgi:hypothetical protein
LLFCEVWSHLEDTDTKITQDDACPEMLPNFGTRTRQRRIASISVLPQMSLPMRGGDPFPFVLLYRQAVREGTWGEIYAHRRHVDYSTCSNETVQNRLSAISAMRCERYGRVDARKIWNAKSSVSHHFLTPINVREMRLFQSEYCTF